MKIKTKYEADVELFLILLLHAISKINITGKLRSTDRIPHVVNFIYKALLYSNVLASSSLNTLILFNRQWTCQTTVKIKKFLIGKRNKHSFINIKICKTCQGICFYILSLTEKARNGSRQN